MRKLNKETGKVEITTVTVVDRYTPRIDGSCDWICEDVVENIKSECKIYVPRGEYSHLSNFEMNYDSLTGCLSDDLKKFQKELDKQFGNGKYEAFVLGAYIHSGTSFSINKTGNRVCRFDSSQLGFIGLPTKSKDVFYSADDPSCVADDLTYAWNGEIAEYQVYDELEEEIVDSCVFVGCKTDSTWLENVKEKYGVSFDGVECVY